jgi:hypothetical protein
MPGLSLMHASKARHRSCALPVSVEHYAHACRVFPSVAQVVLFERATFLVISHSTRAEYTDLHRFEKISNIIKQFKLSCTYVLPRPYQ